MSARIRILSLAAALLLLPALSPAATWQVDPVHTTLEFKVRHLMVSWVKGNFATFEGTLVTDDADLAKSTVDVTIQTASLDTRNEKRDEHLRSADFFDAATHPTLTFVSKKVIVAGGVPVQVIGDLTIRGTTREVTLDVESFTGPVTDPWGGIRRGASATTIINRQDFGLSWNKLLETGGVVVGDEVKIALEIEFIRM